ncbi:TetR/AcrR family transcriptional regulator [Streptomyces sp. JCM17656]|nr:TetR/AcrR family transcriptional regulator [Streptomyces sp. JCM17656]
MTSADSGRSRPRKGFPEKRRAILDASRKVFGRVGYQGASIDMIATEASVSTRTIYNHFENKEQLFSTVLIESSEQVAAAHEAMIERCLGRTSSAAGLEADLVSLAMDWVRPRPEFTDHFAIVARINAEGENFPATCTTPGRRPARCGCSARSPPGWPGSPRAACCTCRTPNSPPSTSSCSSPTPGAAARRAWTR